jgi:hypothetical protein
VEEERVDILEEGRDFVDELARDLRNAGYPNARMYACGTALSGGGILAGSASCNATLGANPASSPNLAVGLVAVSSTDILFEGDVNQDGTVDSVRYQLQPAGGGPCPCSLMRSQRPKQPGSSDPAPIGVQQTAFNVQVDNVINSAGGAAAWPFAGTTPGGVANDVYYATFKTAPVFTFFDANYAICGTAGSCGGLPLPPDLVGANYNAGKALAAQVRAVMITVNILGPTPDMNSKVRPGVTMRTMVRIANN